MIELLSTIIISFLAGFFVRPVLTNKEELPDDRFVIFEDEGLKYPIISETSKGFRLKAAPGRCWKTKHGEEYESFYTWKQLKVEEPMRTYVKMKLEEEKALEELKNE